MSNVHGRNTRVLAGGYDLTGYLRKLGVSGEADTAETTTFGKTSKTYIGGQTDATLTAEGVFDGSADAVDAVLNAALGGPSTLWAAYPAGDTAGNRGWGILSIVTKYDVDSPVDDVVSVSADAQSRVGLDPLVSLHALAAETATDSDAGIDNGGASTGGGAGYLVVTDVAGTGNVVGKVQHSTDNSVWVDLVTFTAVTADHGSERVEVSGTVNRYLRAYWTITGLTAATFHIGFARL